MRPKLLALPRQRLNLDFAVLLMRSSYAIADELDFMPMDEFQKDFFLLRQDEWDEYRQKLPVMQGDLADPAYFDFVSFAQYATIAQGMKKGRIFFEELIDANGTSVVVQRDPKLPQSNDALPALLSERVGERILTWMDNNATNLAPKVPARPTADSLIAGVRQIAAIFELQEFCLTSTVEPLADGGGVSWTLVAPANLWSTQVLQLRGDLANDFEAKAVLAFFRRAGVPATCTTRVEKATQVRHEFRWPLRFLL